MAPQPNGDDSTLGPNGSQPPKLLQRLWQALVARRYRSETVGRFSEWNPPFTECRRTLHRLRVTFFSCDSL